MNIFLIHGDNTDKSYSRLVKFCEAAKKRDWELVYLDDSAISFKENLSSASLFNSDRFFVHRQFTKISKPDLVWLNKNYKKYSGNLVVYSDTLLAKTSISLLPGVLKIEEFKLPVIIWNFLDSIYPGNAKVVIRLLHEIISKQPVEFIFGLVARHLKDLYKTKINSEGLGMPDWRLSKLKNQLRRFQGAGLEELISKLAKADIQSKTTNLSLHSLLNLVLIEKLELDIIT